MMHINMYLVRVSIRDISNVVCRGHMRWLNRNFSIMYFHESASSNLLSQIDLLVDQAAAISLYSSCRWVILGIRC